MWHLLGPAFVVGVGLALGAWAVAEVRSLINQLVKRWFE